MRAIAETIFRDEYRITSRRRALEVLDDLRTKREQLHLLPEGESTGLLSALLDIDAEQEIVVLDVPPVEAAMGRLHDGVPLLALARYAGVHLGFVVDALQETRWREGVALQAAFPSHVYFLQRRQFYRVAVGGGDVTGLALMRLGAPELSGTCQDLSVGGMRLLAPLPQAAKLHRGERLPGVRFTLRGVSLEVTAQVQHLDQPVTLPDGSELLPVGLEFGRRSPLFEQAVSRYVQTRDRELLLGRS